MEKFLSAFSKLDCKDKLKTTYESVMVERISASRSKNMVFVYCQNGEWMPYRVIHQMEQQLYKQIFRPMGFHPQIQMQYPDLGNLPFRRFLERTEPDIKQELREIDYVDAIEFCEEPFECEGNSLYITCGDSFLARRRAEQVQDWFHALFLTRFGKDITIEFRFKEYERKKMEQTETFVMRRPETPKKRSRRHQESNGNRKRMCTAKKICGMSMFFMAVTAREPLCRSKRFRMRSGKS